MVKLAYPLPPNPDYETYPAFSDLLKMTEEELMNVPDFKICNSHGYIEFFGDVDLSGVDLKQVLINETYVEIYKDEDPLKPPLGQKLNRAAYIKLACVRPK